MLSADMLTETGAVQGGHFLLTSGQHSNLYIEKFRILENPTHCVAVCKEMASSFKEDKVDVVVGIVTAGTILSYEVAKQLGVRYAFFERVNGTKISMGRGFEIKPNERVLLVDDVLTTGSSFREMIDALKGKCEIVGATSVIDRSGGKTKLDVPKQTTCFLYSTYTHDPKDCPMCRLDYFPHTPLVVKGGKFK